MNRTGSAVAGAMLAALVVLAGCASMKATEWTGHTIAEVIKEFGSPTRTVPAAGGQTMYVWVQQHSIPQASWGGAPGQPTVQTTSRTQITTWSFLVNQQGVVVSWTRDEGAMY